MFKMWKRKCSGPIQPKFKNATSGLSILVTDRLVAESIVMDIRNVTNVTDCDIYSEKAENEKHKNVCM